MNEHLFLKHLFLITRIPIHVYRFNGEKVESYAVSAEQTAGEIAPVLMKQLAQKPFVFYQYPNLPVAAAACRGMNRVFLLGPVAIGKIEDRAAIRLQKELNLSQISHGQLKDVLLTAVMILNEFSGGMFELEDLQSEICSEPMDISPQVVYEELRQYDAFQKNHTYSEEQQLFNKIREGDVAYIERNHLLMQPPHPVIIADLVKNEEYMAVIGISMAARSAIEGGMTSQEALLANDVYLVRLAACKTVEEIYNVVREAHVYFARCVEKYQQNRSGNRYIEECKKDIISRKKEKIDLQTIADDVGISKGYMLKLFKKQEGISITDYIINVKLEAACNMLKFSDRPISEISDYLSFGSANYFSRIFSGRMGMSPKSYRESHRQPNF